MIWSIIALVLVGLVFAIFGTSVFASLLYYINLANSNFFSALPDWVPPTILFFLFVASISVAISLKNK